MVFEEQKLESPEKMGKFGKGSGRELRTIARLVASNSLIMERIFGFLHFKDLKNCRLTCSMWEEESQKIFESQARIVISLLKRRAEKYVEDFKESPLNIGSYEFHNSLISPSFVLWFMKSKIGFLSSLTLNNVSICDEGEILRQFDLTSLIGENLTNLNINSAVKTQMIISQRNLHSIKYLKLNKCKLIICTGANRIAPWEIQITNVSFVLDDKNGQELNNSVLCPANFIDCKQISVFDVKKEDGFVYSVTSKWDEFSNPCGTLYLCNYNFDYRLLTKSTPLENLTQLTISGYAHRFNWSLLPDTLEALVLDNVRNPLPNPPQGFLPKLKKFKCVFYEQNIPWIFHFASHTSLTSVHLKSLRHRVDCFNLDWLPQSVKELHLDNISVENIQHGNFQLKLKSLTLVKYTLNTISPIVKRFKTNHLAILAKYPITTENIDVIFKILRFPVKYITIGEFKWEDESAFRHSSLSSSVDKLSKYYTFKNGIGKAVQDTQF